MTPWLLYLIQANVSLLGWWAFYRLVLQRFTFYGWNRFYLLGGIFFSLFYPLVDLTAFADQYPTYSRPVSLLAEQVPFVKNQYLPHVVQNDWLLLYVYTAGVLILSLRMGKQLAAVHRIWRSSRPLELGTHRVQLFTESMAPFSFGWCVFIPADELADPDAATILAHERVHARQGHTLDLLLAQTAIILHWFNPVSDWFGQAIRQNLEYLTDRAVLDQGTNRKAYQYSLLRHSVAIRPPTLGSHFSPVDLKARIQQMNRAASSSLWRPMYGVILVLLLGGCGGWSVFQTYASNHFAFYRQMKDPAFSQLQIRAASPKLRWELESLRNYYQSAAWQVQQQAFEAQMNDPEFIRLQQRPSELSASPGAANPLP